MQVEITGVHGYHLSERTEEKIRKKMERLNHFEEIIEDLTIRVNKENSHEYDVSGDVHLKWGFKGHITQSNEDLYDAIDLLFNKLHRKIAQEKEKKKTH